jgi:fatty-acyl-CoA synthase
VIRAFRAGRTAHFKIPKCIGFVEDFPMTVTGKLQKFRVRELAPERLKVGTTR